MLVFVVFVSTPLPKKLNPKNGPRKLNQKDPHEAKTHTWLRRRQVSILKVTKFVKVNFEEYNDLQINEQKFTN